MFAIAYAPDENIRMMGFMFGGLTAGFLAGSAERLEKENAKKT